MRGKEEKYKTHCVLLQGRAVSAYLPHAVPSSSTWPGLIMKWMEIYKDGQDLNLLSANSLNIFTSAKFKMDIQEIMLVEWYKEGL